jgi:hypothetical protein
MRKTAAAIFVLFALGTAASALADQNPTYSGPLSASETAFVQSIQADLNQRFPTAQDAVKAGYIRYTGVDETGAISYANLQWTSQDIRHPSQLWYDRSGHLLGADFSAPYSGGARPQLFGVNPGRWYEFDAHVHYVLRDPATGTMTYDKWIMAPAFKAAGGDPAHPTAQDIVRMGKAKSASDVATVFYFPAVWDLIVWVKPNPNGAFAEKNPTVTP